MHILERHTLTEYTKNKDVPRLFSQLESNNALSDKNKKKCPFTVKKKGQNWGGDTETTTLRATLRLHIRGAMCYTLVALMKGGVGMDHDQIKREIFINAPIQRVWELVSQPAWWVGDAPGPDKVQVGESRVVADTKYGQFPVLIEQAEPPNYLACRWASSFAGEEPKEGNSTLVEFKLASKDEGTLLTVVESGFSRLEVSEQEQRKFFEGNVHGWEMQTEVLRKRAEQ